MTKTNKIIIASAIGLALVAVAFLLYTFDPAGEVLAPKCPSLLITGYECPGCGSQRAIHDLLHLRIGKAFSHNILVPIAIPYIFLGIYLQYFGGREKFPKMEKMFFGKWAAIIILIVVVAYGVLRNVL